MGKSDHLLGVKPMDLKEIKNLIKFISKTDISELEISQEGQTIRVQRGVIGQTNVVHTSQPMPAYLPMVSQQQHQQQPTLVGQSTASVPELETTTVAITSPMVGSFYQAASPESPPFVQVGDMVRKGQVVCIIEAMKLMNEIESEVSGRVVRLLKENATPVEFGEELFLIEPD
ncbi:MAG: acetyl-CoA carboxylase biotin carboxyl carrier protein [Magnetococcus sp. DMHC-6]